MSKTTKSALILLALCIGAGYIGGKYSPFTPKPTEIERCQEMVVADLIAHQKFTANIAQVVSPDFMDVLTEASENK